MSLSEQVRESAEFVHTHATHVKINESGIEAFVASLDRTKVWSLCVLLVFSFASP